MFDDRFQQKKYPGRRQRILPAVFLVFLATGARADSGLTLGYDMQRGLNMYAKVTCSAIFVSGRQPAEALYNSGYVFLPPVRDAQNRIVGNVPGDLTSFRTDFARGTVSLTRRSGEQATASYLGDQGCVVGMRPDPELGFEPVGVQSSLPPAGELDWPMGDRTPARDPLEPESRRRIESALDTAFSPELLTHSFLVVHKGNIVAERYALGIGRDTQVEAWSMGKSLTALLFGVLALQEGFALDEPARLEEWRGKGDPRGAITHAHLLNMASGLRFSSLGDNAPAWERGVPDHHYIYTGVTDAFDYVLDRPLEFEPGTVGRYRNVDPLSIGAIIRRTLERRGDNYWTWPQQALFDKVGIRRQVLETDLTGNFLLTGYNYGTARNWARLAMLVLNDGVANGKRLLPEGWGKFMITGATAWENREYGGFTWVNSVGRYALPRDAAYFSGGGAINRVFMVPQWELIVVRMGHMRGYWGAGYSGRQAVTRRAEGLLNEALYEISSALGYEPVRAAD